MLYKSLDSRAALLSGPGTSAHETGAPSALYNTNPLRRYDEQGRRRRSRTDSLPLRRRLCAELLATGGVRTAKVRDTGTLFIARLRTAGGRMLTRRACNLQNLRGLLLDALATGGGGR